MSLTAVYESPLSFVAVGAIRFYQKWISPYKGFRCAHQALHGQGGCSSFGLKAFSEHSFGEARRMLKVRLKECGAAYASIVAMSNETPEERRRRRRDTVANTAGETAECFLQSLIPGDCGGCAPDSCDIGSCSD